ncbi:MAG: hypothetical protein WA738_01555 [Candidatus Angelobacter sp.]
MNRLSAIDALGPAFARVNTMLFKPFRLGTWLKMGFIGILGGGVATFNSNFNFRAPVMPRQFPRDQLPKDPWADIQSALRSIHLADYLHIILIAVVVLVVISLVFLYLFCRFRFVLFDAVVGGQAFISRGWRRYAAQANRYFGFWLAYRVVNWAVMALIVGLPLWHAYQRGVFSGDNSLIALFEVLASIALGAIAAGIVFGIISTLAKDFLMPVMALDDFTPGDAWSSLWRVIASEPGAWAGYIGMKVICSVGAGIGLAIAMIIAILPAMLIIGIPAGILVVLGVVVVKAAGAIGFIIFGIAGLLVAAGLCCLYLLLTAPVTVFFASYAFYFFGGRYPKLAALLWPQPISPAPTPQMTQTQPVV